MSTVEKLGLIIRILSVVLLTSVLTSLPMWWYDITREYSSTGRQLAIVSLLLRLGGLFAMWRFSVELARVLLPATLRDNVSPWSGTAVLVTGLHLLGLYLLVASLPHLLGTVLDSVLLRESPYVGDFGNFATVAFLEHVVRMLLGLLLLFTAPWIVRRLALRSVDGTGSEHYMT